MKTVDKKAVQSKQKREKRQFYSDIKTATVTQIGNQLIVTTSNEGSVEKRLSNVSQNQVNM